MTCKPCELAASGKSGAYDIHCLACCARLVRDSRPNKQRQRAMLAVISRTPGAPSEEDILAKLEESA